MYISYESLGNDKALKRRAISIASRRGGSEGGNLCKTDCLKPNKRKERGHNSRRRETTGTMVDNMVEILEDSARTIMICVRFNCWGLVFCQKAQRPVPVTLVGARRRYRRVSFGMTEKHTTETLATRMQEDDFDFKSKRKKNRLLDDATDSGV